MRLRSVFKMRISILNTATTEQMGYGIISFFLCVGSRRNECNSLWREKREESKILLLARKIYHPEDYFLSLTSSKEKGPIILQKSKEIALSSVKLEKSQHSGERSK